MVSATEYQKAVEAFAQEQYEEATRLFAGLVESRPADPNLRLWLASAQQQIGRQDLARDQYEVVMGLTADPEILQTAQKALQRIDVEISGGSNFALANSASTASTAHTASTYSAGRQAAEATLASGSSISHTGNSNGNGNGHLPQAAMAAAIEVPPLDLDDFPLVQELELSDISPEFEAAFKQAEPTGEVISIRADGFDPDQFELPGFDNLAESDDDKRQFEESFRLIEEATPPVSAPRSYTALGELPDEVPPMDTLGSLDPARFDVGEGESDFGDAFGSGVATRPATRGSAPASSALTEPPSGGWLADQSLGVKQAMAIGGLTLTTVAAVNGAVYYAVLTSGIGEAQQQVLQNASLIGGAIGAGVIGVATLGVSWLLNRAVVKPIQQLHSTARLVAEGDVNARFEPRASDEVGQLAATFNKMASDLQRGIGRAEEEMTRQQRDKEQLQEEIIHLLDQVEGASRGDLTVKAEVSASLTGAVADAFNVTIASLRRIIVQVKQSVQKVNQAALDSESFARGLSKEALRQAEEISTSRESIQVMTRSIQQVAQNASRAESVARLASETATRGGEAVDRTVQGILSLRETVSETGKKVKRLAESTQEISKIVALINQLSSRTNLLALNASIEAVRAGEAGRGFAIVADEVRQLADRAAKATREIEGIVLNIQSETGAVMQAMEKGTQQVVIGTQLAEEAKQSLEQIIQVSQQIDVLVAEIAQETIEQENTSRSVAGVMETVEATAQTTSSESRRVSDALQGLVAVAQDLREATDRFQVENES